MSGHVNPMKTTFTNVILERTVRTGERRVRPHQGRKVMKIILEAMNAGHTVSMRTHYDVMGTELMDAEIVYDGEETP